MEVHHHSHTARKKWTHYFWEFLMLFLAVFCGFLAENQREHFVEGHRAREYAKSLLSDIRLDSAEISNGYNITTSINEAFDSIISIAKQKGKQNTIPGRFYLYSKFATYSFRADWSKSTIDQLVQSGNLRYFKDKELVSLINRYYYIQGLISAQNQIEGILRDQTLDVRNSILVNEYYLSFTQNDFDSTGKLLPSIVSDSLILRQLPLQENADKHMDKYLNYITDRKTRTTMMRQNYYSLANSLAQQIIKGLIKEYRLK